MRTLLLIVAIVLFILAALGVSAVPNVVDWGFVFLAASFLPIPESWR